MQQNGSAQNGGSRPKIEPQYVRFVGDSVGVVNLTPAALQCLSDQVTQLLIRTIHTSKQYALHGRRMKLNAEDIEESMNQMKIEAPFGASARRGPQLRQFTMPSGEELYVRDEYDMDVTTVVEEPKPKYPLQPYLKAHWLAFEGKLALVPENVRPMKEEEEEDVLPASETAKAAAIVARRETAGGSLGASVSFRASSRQVATKEQILIKAPIVEPLSVEQQMYIKDIIEAIVGSDDERRQAALKSLEVDTGLQAILPKFSRLVNNTIRCNLLMKCMSLLIYMVRVIRSMSENPAVSLTGVLHELLPPLLSCMLGRSLCKTPETDNHWALRDYAAKTLIVVIKRHKDSAIRERALRVIKKVWEDPTANNSMLYGCLLPLIEFVPPGDPYRAVVHKKVVDVLRFFAAIDESSPATAKVEQQKMGYILSKMEMKFRPFHGRIDKSHPSEKPISFSEKPNGSEKPNSVEKALINSEKLINPDPENPIVPENPSS